MHKDDKWIAITTLWIICRAHKTAFSPAKTAYANTDDIGFADLNPKLKQTEMIREVWSYKVID